MESFAKDGIFHSFRVGFDQTEKSRGGVAHRGRRHKVWAAERFVEFEMACSDLFPGE
jgi:hypothetical protein